MFPRTLYEIGIVDRVAVEQDITEPSRVIIFFDDNLWDEMLDSQKQAVKAEMEHIYDRMNGCALTPAVLYALRGLVTQHLQHLIQRESAPGRFE